MKRIFVSVIVFAIAIVLRVPSCYESFWVDELHSTWTVWGDFKEIFPRARIGNQTPFYFVGLWLWKNSIGESELALRLTSVLATALAASLMTVGVARWSRSLVAGTAAGLVLAVETNAIFFGTELRPYAFVILASTIGTLCILCIASNSESSNRARIVLVLATLAAALLQPTSLGVLIWLFVGLAVNQIVTSGLRARISITGLLLATATLAVGWTLWQTTLASTWRLRSNWESFAKSPPWTEAANLWSWGVLWLAPLLLVFAPLGRWLSTDYSRRERTAIAMIGVACFLAAASYWIASRSDWVHLWHRRYAVALLPMFAALVGAAAGRFQVPESKFQIRAIGIAAALIFCLASSQGVIQTAIWKPNRLAYRGEDWRGAIEWINENTMSSDRLLVDCGLIEQKLWVPHQYPPNWLPATLQEQYMLLPVSGPYATRLAHPTGSDSQSLASAVYNDVRLRSEQVIHFQVSPRHRRRIVFLSRRPAGRHDLRGIRRIGSKYIESDEIKVHGFGGVSIMVIPLARDI